MKVKMDKPKTRFILGIISTIIGGLTCVALIVVDVFVDLPEELLILYLISLALMSLGLYVFLTTRIYKLRYASQNIFARPVTSEGKDLNSYFDILKNQTKSEYGSFTPYEAKLQIIIFSLLTLGSLAILFFNTSNFNEIHKENRFLVFFAIAPFYGVIFSLRNLSYRVRLVYDKAIFFLGILVILSIPVLIFFMWSAQINLEKIIMDGSMMLFIGIVAIYSSIKDQKDTKELMESAGIDCVSKNLKDAMHQVDNSDNA